MNDRGSPRLAWLVVVGILSAQPARAQIYRPDPVGARCDSSTVSVTGTAERYAPPDRAVIYLQIVNRGASAEAAAMENGSARSEVIARLVDLGVDEDRVGLWGFGSGSTTPAFGPPRGAPGEEFEVRSGLRIELESLERLDPVVSTALLAGATISRVELHSEDRDALHREAVAEAVRRARATAEAMVEAAGGRLGPLLNISAGNSSANAYWLVPYNGRPEGDGVSLDRNQTSVRALVQVTWSYRPGGG